MKKRKKSVSQLKRKADILFSKWIRQRNVCEAKWQAGYRCSSQLQCAHIFTRARNATRYDKLNALSLCSGHHRYFHQYPIEFTQFVSKHLTAGVLHDLQLKSRSYKSFTVDELQKLIKTLKTLTE